jgi:hypothetical protein
MHESEWKQLRQLKVVALDRLCAAALRETQQMLSAPGQSSYERFLAIFRQVVDRNDDIAVGFDDLRRSTAEHRLAAMSALGLITEDELAQFSEKTRDSVEFLAKKLYSGRVKKISR